MHRIFLHIGALASSAGILGFPLSVNGDEAKQEVEALTDPAGEERASTPAQSRIEIAPVPKDNAVETEVSVYGSVKKTAVWSLVGLSGAAVIAGGIFGLTALDEKERYEDSTDQSLAKDFDDRRRARALASYISFGVAGAAAIGAFVVWIVMDENNVSSRKESSVAADGAFIIVKF